VGNGLQVAGDIVSNGGLFVQGTTSFASAITGGVTINGLSSPSAPIVTSLGTTGASTYKYAVSAVGPTGNETLTSTDGQTTNGNATLTGAHGSKITWSPVSGAVSYKVYRTSSNGSPATTGLIGTTTVAEFYDGGLAASGSVPTANSTGGLTVNGNGLFKSITNNATAFQVQNAAGNNYIQVDTSGATLSLGNTGIASTIQIGNTAGAVSQTINIGNSSTAGSTTNLVIGSTIGSSTTTLQAGTGNINLLTNNSSAGTKVKTNANSTTGFQVQNSNGDSLVQVDTVNSNITLNGNNAGDLQTWQTSSGNPLPSARYQHNTIIANGYVYVIGGRDTADVRQSTVYYAKLNADGTTSAWTTSANPLPGSRNSMASVAINGYLYVIGGSDGTVQSTTLYAKLNSDGSTSSWRTTTTLPVTLVTHTAAAVNGYIYVIGGSTDGTAGNAVSTVYYARANADGTVGSWTTNTNALPTTDYLPFSTVANGYLYIIGGYDNTNTGVTNAMYAKLNSDGSTGTWSSTAVGVGGGGWGVGALNGYLYIHGFTGVSYYYKLGSSGAPGTQTATASVPTSRIYFGNTQASANGYMYIAGGSTDGTGANAASTVYYASTSRVKVSGSLDLVGISGQDLQDAGNQGGSITASNINALGALSVRGDSVLGQSLSVANNLNVGGSALFQNAADSTTAYQVQNAAGTSLLTVDTSGSVITFSGTTTTFAVITLNNAHFKSTQTTAPTIGTPTNCATTPTASVAGSSTDNAGSFTITAGTGGGQTTCDTVFTFNKTFGAAPKAVILTPVTSTGAGKQIYVSATSATTFTVKMNTAPANSEANTYYYWVVE
jgi:hypothetical protein